MLSQKKVFFNKNVYTFFYNRLAKQLALELFKMTKISRFLIISPNHYAHAISMISMPSYFRTIIYYVALLQLIHSTVIY